MIFIFLSVAFSSTFGLHLASEPTSIKPWEQKNSNSSYFLSQIYGTLLKLKDGELKPSLAENCEFKKPKEIECTIAKSAKFSDGSQITAEDFKRSWLKFLSPDNHAFRADILFPVKSAEEYYSGKAQEKDVGIKVNKNKLILSLHKEDPDFLYVLTTPLLAPFKGDIPDPDQTKGLVTSGAYTIENWQPQKKITLKKRESSVKVEFFFVREETTALNLYEKNQIQFLRRLPTIFIPKYKDRKDFHQINQMRMDYIGFGPELKDKPELREALAKSLNYPEVEKLLVSRDRFSCPGMPKEMMSDVPCIDTDLKVAKEKLDVAKTKGPLPKLAFAFSKQGGDDHKMVAEWAQNQWKKNLGLDVMIEQVDNKIFVDQLKEKPYPLFRKGINPERPTCLSAMEYFTPESNEYFLKVSAPKFEKTLAKLKSAKSPLDKQKACSEAMHFLLDDFKLIPTGLIHFTILVKPEWTGWSLNELNQLDLSELRLK